jgi:hypothetical protein
LRTLEAISRLDSRLAGRIARPTSAVCQIWDGSRYAVLKLHSSHNRVMATVHMSEAELARDLHSVLAQVQQGIEVVVEQDHRPVAVIRA